MGKFRFMGVLLGIFLPFLMAGQNLSMVQVEEDLAEFERVLKVEAAYLGRTDLDPDAEMAKLRLEFKDRETVRIFDLQWKLEAVIAKLGDRHARVHYPRGTARMKRLPFAVAPFEGQVLALNETSHHHFACFSANFPYLKSIQGISVDSLMQVSNLRHAAAPGDGARFRAVAGLRKIERIFQRLNIPLKNPMPFTLSNGRADTLCQLSLSKKGPRWTYAGNMPSEFGKNLDEFEYGPLFQWKSKKTAYLAIPEMIGRDDHEAYFELLDDKMEEFANAEALIIDLRGNLGGWRDLVAELVPRFQKPNGPAKVLNVAFLRSDQEFSEDTESMMARYLFTDHSPFPGPVGQIAVRNHLKSFRPEWELPAHRFSKPYFFVARGHFRKPEKYFPGEVYVMVDELTYSAAGFFAVSCQGIGQVKMVGKAPDPCSGRVLAFPLPNSKMEIQVSRMASFHPDGRLFDGNEFAPDIELERDLEQIFGNRDSQLEQLLRHIESKN